MLELKEGVSHPLWVLVREIQSSAGATGTLKAESSSQPVGIFSFVHDPPTVSGMFIGKTSLPIKLPLLSAVIGYIFNSLSGVLLEGTHI